MGYALKTQHWRGFKFFISVSSEEMKQNPALTGYIPMLTVQGEVGPLNWTHEHNWLSWNHAEHSQDFREERCVMEIVKNLKQREKQTTITPCNRMQNKNTRNTGYFSVFGGRKWYQKAMHNYEKKQQQGVKCTHWHLMY